jgi:hypothetical protein
MTGKPANPPAAQKYEVVVVTTGPSSEPDTTAGDVPLKNIVKKAFEKLVITAPLDSFTYSNDANRSVKLDDKIEDACDGKKECKIFATAIKAQDA